jgi:hypothetical protein
MHQRTALNARENGAVDFFGDGLVEHGLAEIHPDQFGLRTEPACQSENYVSASRGQVEDLTRGALSDSADQLAAPPSIDPTAEQPICKVVANGDA